MILTTLTILASEPSGSGLLANLTDPTVLVALIGAVIGGIGLKLLEAWLGRGKEKSDLATQIRDELRKDMLTLRTHFDNCEIEKDKWQDKYWLTVEENAQLKAAQAMINWKMGKLENLVEDVHPDNEHVNELRKVPKDFGKTLQN